MARRPSLLSGILLPRLYRSTAPSTLILVARRQHTRLVLETFTLLCVVVLSAEKVAVKASLDRVAEYRCKHRKWQVLIVGEQHEAQAYLRLLETHTHCGVAVAGIVSPTQQVPLAAVPAASGGAQRAAKAPVGWRELLKRYVVDEVVAVSPWSKADLGDLQEACAKRGLIFRMLVTMPAPQFGHYSVDDIGGGSYLVSLEAVPQDFLPLMVKRALDIAGALVGLILCGLVSVCYAPLLWWKSPGPVFFKPKRGGHDGRIFTAYKFRTMCTHAERVRRPAKGSVRLSKFGLRGTPLAQPPRPGLYFNRLYLELRVNGGEVQGQSC